MREYIATFGDGHTLRNCYCRVPAENESQACSKMFETYGDMWAFLYNSADAAGVGRWNLREVPFGEPNERLSNCHD